MLKHNLLRATGELSPAWDLSYAKAPAWDVSTASFVQSFSVAAQETGPMGLSFKPDGLKMYVVGFAGDDVNEYNLSTAWNVSTASFVQSFSVAAQETEPYGLFFKPDGLKMYVVGFAGRDVNEYNLSTAWNVSTASFVQSFSVAAQETEPYGLSFKPDGLKMYVMGSSGDDVNEYNLSTAWNVATASFVQSFSVAAQDTNPRGLFFEPDGLKMYVVGVAGQDVNEYTLGTAWNVSTASFVQSFSVAAQDTNPRGLFFKPDGLKMYVVGATGDTVIEYALGNFSVAAQETQPYALFFKPDGLKLYVMGISGDDVNEYNLSTAWNVSTATFVQSFSVLAQDNQPYGLFFRSDGLKMYVSGNLSDAVNEYNLSTAWNVSTASFVQSFSVAAQETTPSGLFFKPDGLKMYVLGINGKAVNEYNLSTAWNVSTASFVQSFSVAAQEASPVGLFFKPDGLKMYVAGFANDAVNEYNLSTAWNVSTATFVQSLSAFDLEPILGGVFFKPDGLKMYVVGAFGDAVIEYTFSLE